MKKITKILVAMLLVFALAACSSGDKGDGDKGGDKKVRVALIIQNLGDMSFNDSANEGMKRAQSDLGVDVKVMEYGTDVSKQQVFLQEAAEEGYNVIITPSNFVDYLDEIHEQYPDIQFILFDASMDYEAKEYKNIYSIVYSANQPSYAAGYLGAKQSKTGVLGFLGGEEAPTINDFLLGYIEGAKAANPDVKVVVSFVGNWVDSAKGKELTLAMVNQGADVVFAAAGGAGMGIFEAAVERDIWAIGVDSDQALMFKEAGNLDQANRTLTSVEKRVGDSLYRALDLYIKGTLPSGSAETLGIKEGGVGLSDNEFYQSLVSEDVRNAVAETIDKIKDGSITVPTYYGMDTAEFESIKAGVRP